MRKYAIATAAALVASVALATPSAHAAENITSGGSSYANAILTACAASYTTDKITYASTGSGAGRSNFLSGSYDFGASDAAYAATDTKPAKFTYVPLVGGPIAAIFNVPGVKNLNLTAKVLGGIMNGRYTTWNDVEIVKLNPSANLPSNKINVVYRSDKSGTVENFAMFLAGNGATGYKANGSWATASSQATPVGSGANGSQAMTASVASTTYSIGFADLSDAASKNLSTAAIRNPLGQFLKPSAKSASTFLAVQRVSENGILEIDYKKPVKNGYNMSLVTYALAPTASANSAKGAAVKKFLTYVINTCAPSKGPGLSYSPITGALKAKALKLVATVK